jgi:hypothetical protein
MEPPGRVLGSATPVPGGRVPPLPAPPVFPEPLPEPVAWWLLASTLTVADAEAPAAACGEVPVTVSVIFEPFAFAGTPILAWSSTACAESPAGWQVAWPGGWHTVNRGERLPGLAESLTVAVPFLPDMSHTQIANLAPPPGWTIPFGSSG